MTPRPPRPVGQSREAAFAQWVWDSLSKLDSITGGPGVSVSSGPRGVTISIVKSTVGVQGKQDGEGGVWL